MSEYNDVEDNTTPRLSGPARSDLQCNIVESVNRTRSLQLFVRFETEADFRAWLVTVPPVTSQAESGKGTRDVNLLFTPSGLRKLGASVEALSDPAFRRGARDPKTIGKLRDTRPSTWSNHGHPWDAALLIHSNEHLVLSLPAGLNYQLERGNSIGADGMPLANPDDPRFNLFGYRDGLSATVYEDPEGGFTASTTKYDPRRKLSTLLVRDPYSPGAGKRFGSYFVFRKYAMNQQAFVEKVERIALAIEKRAQSPESRVPLGDRFAAFAGLKGEPLRTLVRAWIVGRHPDGKTLSTDGYDNDFNFDDDVAATKCPFHAHIAKMNPRGRTGDVAAEHARSLARRGISYGHSGTVDKGLLFWCAQASIQDQFEFVQQKWANDDEVDLAAVPTPDLDNVVGKRFDPPPFEGPDDPYARPPLRYDRWKGIDDGTIDMNFGIYDTITLEGSEYFFAPSLSGIAALKGSPEPSQAKQQVPMLELKATENSLDGMTQFTVPEAVAKLFKEVL